MRNRLYYHCTNMDLKGEWATPALLFLSEYFKQEEFSLAISVAEKVFGLVKETVEAQNVQLWDVRFVKEGASWYLRVIIDSENGISIDDCTNVHHAIDPILDEADPIEKSDYLEVCSPGLERELTRDEHFGQMQGEKIKLKLYKRILFSFFYSPQILILLLSKMHLLE